MILELSPVLAARFRGDDAFDQILRLEGREFRHHKNRRTIRVELDGRGYFVKIHGRTSWREILKNVLRGSAPVLDASPERAAIECLRRLRIPTVRAVGYGRRGRPPTGVESFIITEELDGFVHLDEAAAAWVGMEDPLRMRLLRRAAVEIASIARAMHGAGMNHRDLYLCHFMLPDRPWDAVERGEALDVHVIDLHRVQRRARVPARWRVKDLAGILFSALDLPLTRREIARFLAEYEGISRRRALADPPFAARTIVRRAIRVYRSDHGRAPRLPEGLASFA